MFSTDDSLLSNVVTFLVAFLGVEHFLEHFFAQTFFLAITIVSLGFFTMFT